MDRDRSSLFYVARALHALQQRWGTIPHVKGKGDAAAAGAPGPQGVDRFPLVGKAPPPCHPGWPVAAPGAAALVD